jgi:hypothetical protein
MVKRSRWYAVLALLVATAPVLAVGAEPYAMTWGPPLNTDLPPLAAQDQDGELRQLADLRGRRGLLLFLVRSADW